MRSWVALLLLPLLGLLGCAPSTSRPASSASGAGSERPPETTPGIALYARDAFARAFSCPASRILVTPAGEAIPTSIAGDSERVAVWQKNRSGVTVFEVEGCGVRERSECHGAGGRGSWCLPAMDPPASAGSLAASSIKSEMSDRVEELRANLPPGRPRVGVTWMGAAGGPFVVTAVLPGGPADGKLRVGDVLVAVAGEHVTDAIRLVKAIQAHDGKTLEVTVRRDGLEVTEPVHVSSY